MVLNNSITNNTIHDDDNDTAEELATDTLVVIFNIIYL
jgi:hypothetical protein